MRRNGRTEIRMEREIRGRVHMSIREQTVTKKKEKKKKRPCECRPSFSSGFTSCAAQRAWCLHNMYSTPERTWSLWDYSLLCCDYMVENTARVSHIWAEGLGICKWENASEARWSDAKQWALCRRPCTFSALPWC